MWDHRKFNEFIFNAINGMASLTEIEREALKYYILLVNEDYFSTRVLPLEMAKGLNLLPEKVAGEADFINCVGLVVVEGLQLPGFLRGKSLRSAAVSSASACSCKAGLGTLPDDVPFKLG